MKTQTQIDERSLRRKKAFDHIKQLEVKYGRRFGKDFFDFLVTLAAINPYYFWPKDGVCLWERPYEDSLADSAKRMQEGATKRIEREFPDFFLLIERYKARKDQEQQTQVQA